MGVTLISKNASHYLIIRTANYYSSKNFYFVKPFNFVYHHLRCTSLYRPFSYPWKHPSFWQYNALMICGSDFTPRETETNIP